MGRIGREARGAAPGRQRPSMVGSLTRSANLEAVNHLKRGLDLVSEFADAAKRSRTELELQLALGPPLIATQGYTANDTVRAFARARASRGVERRRPPVSGDLRPCGQTTRSGPSMRKPASWPRKSLVWPSPTATSFPRSPGAASWDGAFHCSATCRQEGTNWSRPWSFTGRKSTAPSRFAVVRIRAWPRCRFSPGMSGYSAIPRHR